MTIENNRDAAPISARVVAQHRDRYVVRDSAGADLDAVLSGRFRHEAASAEDLPAVGDWVSLVGGTDGATGQIREVLPRKSAFCRKSAGAVSDVQIVAANVDLAIVATALPHDVNLRRIERYLTLAWEGGAMPLIVLTKVDLVDDAAEPLAEVRAIAPGVDVLAISTFTGFGISELSERLAPGVTAVLLGSSGIGKSTLVNALLGIEHQRTSPVRDDGAGRHTTTHRELLELPGGAFLIDTPGMREMQLWSADDGLESAFDDITTLANECRFGDCAHGVEPGCAVRAAVDRGEMPAARVESWHALRRELAYLERRQSGAATAAARARTKTLIRALRTRLRDKYD